MSIITQSCRAPTPDERMSAWAAVWYACGFHRAPERTQPLRQPAPLASPVRTGALPIRAPDAGMQASGTEFSSIAEWEAYWRGDAPEPTLPPF